MKRIVDQQRGAKRVAVADRAAAAGAGRRQHEIRRERSARAGAAGEIAAFERQHAGMLLATPGTGSSAIRAGRPKCVRGMTRLHRVTMVAEITDKALLRRRLRRAHRRGDRAPAFCSSTSSPTSPSGLPRSSAGFQSPSRMAGRPRRSPMRFSPPARSSASSGLSRPTPPSHRAGSTGVVGDEEALPLAPDSIDLFASALALQWTNDLPGALIQIRAALRPDGLLLAAMTGGRTLAELREALAAAESEMRGGASPRVMPAADVRDLGALLQRAGFALPVADRDALTVRYDSAFDLFRDLRAMGAANALPERERRPATRRLFLRAAEIYAERFSDPDGRVRATFEIVSLSGWAPHESQQKPAQARIGQGQPRRSARAQKKRD